MDDIYEDINRYNPTRKRKTLIVFVFDSDIMTNKTYQATIKELFIRCRRLTISLAFITHHSYSSVSKEVIIYA